MALDEYRRKRDFSSRRSLKATQDRAGSPGASRCSSASRNIWPVTFTTISVSSTTASCSRGPCRRGRRSIRKRSDWRCTSRITRWSTAPSKASFPRVRRRHRHALGQGHLDAEVRDVSAALEKGTSSSRWMATSLKGSWVLCRRAGMAATAAMLFFFFFFFFFFFLLWVIGSKVFFFKS